VCERCRPFEEHALIDAFGMDAETLHGIRSMLEGTNPTLTPRSLGEVGRSALSFMEARLDRPLSSLPLVRAMMKAKAYA
jgi:hypothetical protein